jgi:hypothetical protein
MVGWRGSVQHGRAICYLLRNDASRAQPVDENFLIYRSCVRCRRFDQRRRMRSSGTGFPAVREFFPDAVEVAPAFLIEWDLRGEPPEAWVNDAIDRRAQLYSPAKQPASSTVHLASRAESPSL